MDHPVARNIVTPEMAIDNFKQHFNIVANGLCISNPGLTWEQIWPCMAEAMGRVCSDATKNDCITNVPMARACLKSAFEKGLSHVPAIMTAGSVPPMPDAMRKKLG